jgi:peptidoglycan/xylan/chitin deacetylase (PgdA/CDA1 family)
LTLKRTLSILTFHGVGRPHRRLEPGEDRLWLGVDRFEQVLDSVLGRDDVRITFDDGNDSDVEIALPRLVDRGLTAEFFVIAGRVDRPGSISSDGVRALSGAGMTVGSHGWAHRDWRGLDDKQAHQELVDAPDLLSELAGRPISSASVPFGSYDRVVLRRLRHAGVQRVYTSDGGPAVAADWLQARTSLADDHLPAESYWFEHRTSARRQLRRVAARMIKRWRGPTAAAVYARDR